MTNEISFSIPVSGVIRIVGNQIIITVNPAETSVRLPSDVTFERKEGFVQGTTLSDIALEVAHQFIRQNDINQFTANDLFRLASAKNPWIKRSSFVARVIGATPNHPSAKHYPSGKNYFSYQAGGLYRLNDSIPGDPYYKDLG